ncbi:putative cytochrome P450 [Rosa chinensis]|uniref:Putative cytochrome P450 n=1 Tax=Rosa chinensis TaxID=74649 RepID=A0A2P6QVM8_ROSCH|nr:cytochrome P450 736A117 [Rosa chinensis]PRQ38240.1 putative cytochrome P450 [Rosa chinensis]
MIELTHKTSLFMEYYFTLTLVLCLPIFFVLFRRWSSVNTKNQPPSPPKLPFLGNLHLLDSHPHRSLQALAHHHGPLMLLHFGSVPVLVVSSAEAAHEVLKTHDLTVASRPTCTVFKKLFYNCKDMASAPYGEYWRQLRSICVLNLLSTKMVRSFRAVREEETKFMISRIEQSCMSSSSKSSIVNLSEKLVTLTIDVTCRVTTGRKYNSIIGEDGKIVLFKDLLGEFIEILGSVYIGDYIPWLAWLTRVNGLDSKLDKVAKQFDGLLDRVIQDHIEQRSKSGNIKGNMNHTDDHDENGQKDFVDVLLGIQEDSSSFPIDRITVKALIMDMFSAATDSSYAVLEWTMAELLKHPRVMKKLQNEVREIAGNKVEITEDDLNGMKYLKAVIKETLRLHPPFTLLFRMSTEDKKIKGYNIKANTQIIVNTWQIGRDPKSYSNPDNYEPERFLNSDVDYIGNHFEFIPFGAGRRRCPGIQYAAMVSEIALANLVYLFDWAVPGGLGVHDIDMTESTGFITQMKYPLKAVAIPYLG